MASTANLGCLMVTTSGRINQISPAVLAVAVVMLRYANAAYAPPSSAST